MHNGFCTLGGLCFRQDEIDYQQAHKLLKELIDSLHYKTGTTGVRVFLAQALMAMEHHRSIGRD